MLPLFLPRWPQFVACLWDPSTPQLAAAAAPLLAIVGALVASSRAAAAAAEAAADAATADTGSNAAKSAQPAGASTPAPSSTTPAAGITAKAPATPAKGAAGAGAPVSLEAPPPPASLLFDWLVPLLTGAVPLPTGVPGPVQLQVLLCKTLAYALQQLPSCTDTCNAVSAAKQPQPTGTSGSTESGTPAPSQAGESAAAQLSAAVPASAPAGKGKLLAAPVPPVAAEQLRQHATTVMGAVQQLLEAVSTPPELLGPLLQLLLEVIRLAHTVVTGE